MKNTDVRAELVSQIVGALKQGVVPWKCPWAKLGVRNVASGKQYRGINAMALPLHMMRHGFTVPVYGTFNQWKSVGGSVKKRPDGLDEYSARIVFYSKATVQDKRTGDDKVVPILRAFSVFAAEQVNGVDLDALRQTGAWDGDVALGEKVRESSGVPVTHGGDRASYSPMNDRVYMPTKEQFAEVSRYYATLFHELAHSTGHHSRLNRDMSGQFGDESYAREELIADMASVYVAQACGLPVGEYIGSHAAYLESWARLLGDTPTALHSISGLAGKAADYLLERAGVKVADEVVAAE